jgi:glycine betaine/proline transport system substrate-binding protein
MMHRNVFHKHLFTALTVFALLLGGCSGEHEADQSQPERKQEVELAYVEWSSEVASTNVVRAVLEQLGYQVKITPVSAAAMWQAVGAGDADAMVAAWLPTTHGHYLDKVRDQVVDLGANLDGTKIGLVVPQYVAIDGIGQLNGISDRIDGKIIGIDPGAGLMSKTEKVIREYGLDLDLLEGSGATMTAALGDAIKNNAWIVVTGWTPHWMFARWDLRYLDDPKGIYGGAEQIHTIVRQGLESDMPEVYAVLDRFYWTPDDMAELMVWNQEEGADPYENAKRWIREHPDKVAGWTGKQPSM